MDKNLAIKIIIILLLIPPLAFSIFQLFQKFRPSKIEKIDAGIKLKIYSSFILPALLIISVLTFYISIYKPNGNWVFFGLIFLIFLSLPAILIEHFISYWRNIRVDYIDNNWKDRSLSIHFKSGESVIVNKKSIETVFYHKIKMGWERLPWGSFQYLTLKTKDNKTIFLNHLETDVSTVHLLLHQYGISSLDMESLTIPMKKNACNIL